MKNVLSLVVSILLIIFIGHYTTLKSENFSDYTIFFFYGAGVYYWVNELIELIFSCSCL